MSDDMPSGWGWEDASWIEPKKQKRGITQDSVNRPEGITYDRRLERNAIDRIESLENQCQELEKFRKIHADHIAMYADQLIKVEKRLSDVESRSVNHDAHLKILADLYRELSAWSGNGISSPPLGTFIPADDNTHRDVSEFEVDDVVICIKTSTGRDRDGKEVCEFIAGDRAMVSSYLDGEVGLRGFNAWFDAADFELVIRDHSKPITEYHNSEGIQPGDMVLYEGNRCEFVAELTTDQSFVRFHKCYEWHPTLKCKLRKRGDKWHDQTVVESARKDDGSRSV